MNNTEQLTALFLSQSYHDAWDDYIRTLTMEWFPRWDYIILTASDENQANGYRLQLAARSDFLPKGTRFVVIPDEGNVRIGSGGATLAVLKYIYEQECKKDRGDECTNAFAGLRILLIHSGGDSKRAPMYSAIGKLFSPVPHCLPDGRPSTLFDEIIIMMSSLPMRIRDGLLAMSGDALLLFNPLQIEFSNQGATAISFKEHVSVGKNHGVFLSTNDGIVEKFLHKHSEDSLRREGAVNGVLYAIRQSDITVVVVWRFYIPVGGKIYMGRV